MVKVIAWIMTLLGTAVWLYGYFTVGTPPLFDYSVLSAWISNYFPNLEAESGFALMLVGTVLTYWPSNVDTRRREHR